MVRPKPGPGLRNQLPVQKIIWNLYFLFHHRFRHKKLIRKNQSKGVHRVKKNKQDLLLSGGGLSYLKDRNRDRLGDGDERDVTNISETFKVEKKIRDEEEEMTKYIEKPKFLEPIF